MICATFSSPASFFNQARATLQPKERDETRIRKIIGKDNPRVASGSRRRSREEKGAESAVSGFARVADTRKGSGRLQLHDVPLIMQHRWTGHGQFVGGKQRV